MIWVMVNEIAMIIRPISVMITKLGGDSCIIHKVVPAWRELLTNLTGTMEATNIPSDEEKRELLNNVVTRKNATLKHAIPINPMQSGNNFMLEKT